MNRYPSQAGLGASSVMLILVTLCLTVFSMLALLSARVDANLSARTMAAGTAYYAAEAAAEQRLCDIDALLQAGGDPAQAGLAAADGDGLSFTVEIDTTRALYVRFTVENGFADVKDRRVTPVGDWSAETAQNLY